MAYYDYDEDRALIKGAFCSSFGMLPQDFEDLTYRDYVDLFPSIDGETTFANILRVRMETNKDRIKDFSKSEYAEWIKWQRKKKEFDERQALRKQSQCDKNNQERHQKLLIAQQRLNEMLKR